MKKNIVIALVVMVTSILLVIFIKDETVQLLAKGGVIGSITYLLLKILKIKRLDEK